MPLEIDPVVAVDTNVLVWAIHRTGRDNRHDRAKWLFDQFDQRQTRIVISAIVLSEYLTWVDPSRHAAVTEQLSRRFVLAPFNVSDAGVAATLFGRGKQHRVAGQAGGRAILRADTLVIAAAKGSGAGTLYTTDDQCRALAATIMKAEDLPPASTAGGSS